MNTTTPTPYNPDHARRGGVFVIETMNGLKFFYTIVNNIPVKIQRDSLEPLELGEHKTPEIPLKEIEEAGCKVYMASESDCIEAGIAYIKPPYPMRSNQIPNDIGEIIHHHLETNGYSGLYQADTCACSLKDGLAPYESCFTGDCAPGYVHHHSKDRTIWVVSKTKEPLSDEQIERISDA